MMASAMAGRATDKRGDKRQLFDGAQKSEAAHNFFRTLRQAQAI